MVEPDDWCRECGCQAMARDAVVWRLAHEPFGWRPTPAASWRPADSDHGYTLNWDEPCKWVAPIHVGAPHFHAQRALTTRARAARRAPGRGLYNPTGGSHVGGARVAPTPAGYPLVLRGSFAGAIVFFSRIFPSTP